jgi:hypothetical protein
MTVTDELVQNNATYASGFDHGDLPMPRGRRWPWWRAWTRT